MTTMPEPLAALVRQRIDDCAARPSRPALAARLDGPGRNRRTAVQAGHVPVTGSSLAGAVVARTRRSPDRQPIRPPRRQP
jgi:hypothetical protein